MGGFKFRDSSLRGTVRELVFGDQVLRNLHQLKGRQGCTRVTKRDKKIESGRQAVRMNSTQMENCENVKKWEKEEKLERGNVGVRYLLRA